MRFVKFQGFLAKIPGSRRLADLAEAERGAEGAQPEFNRAVMVGLPIAVGSVLPPIAG